MKVILEKIPAFKIIGKGRVISKTEECPKIWRELYELYSHEKLIKLGRGYPFGMCRNWESKNKFEYFAGYDYNGSEKINNLEIVEIPEAEYARVEIVGSVPSSIHLGWKFLMEEYFPQNNFYHAGSPDFEVYYPGDTGSEDYKMELWVPIKRK